MGSEKLMILLGGLVESARNRMGASLGFNSLALLVNSLRFWLKVDEGTNGT